LRKVDIVFKEPTDEELRASALQWQSIMEPLLIDKWSPGLLALSAPTTFLEFPMELAREWWQEEETGWSDTAERFASEIDRACGWDLKFFRLNSRSPKDWMWPLKALVSCSGRTMLWVMRGSERMLDDLTRFARADVKPVLCLRDVLYGCTPSWELRVFVKNGVVKAVAEYGHGPTLRFPRESDEELRTNAERYVLDVVGPHLPRDTVVVDLFCELQKFTLIEINPYGLSDPVGAVSYEAIEAGIPGIARHSARNKQEAARV
jgi:hypothetical protein